VCDLPWLPPGYRLDWSDVEVLILSRYNGYFVAAFSTMGATKEGIRHAAEEDHRKLTDPGPAHRRRDVWAKRKGAYEKHTRRS